MSFAAFMERLLATGEALLPVRFETASSPELEKILADAFSVHALSVAGPPIAFDAASAVLAAQFLGQALWCSAHRGEPLDELERGAKALATVPESPAAILSMDLSLRLLPPLLQRARAVEPGGRLPALIEEAMERSARAAAHAGLELLLEERAA